MSSVIGVLKETMDAETRVAMTPDVVRKMVSAGHSVLIERGAGDQAFYSDESYAQAGAAVMDSPADIVRGSNCIWAVNVPDAAVLSALQSGTVVIGLVHALTRRDVILDVASLGATLLGMEYVPRISRAQGMDALSSQSNLAGYRAVVESAAFYGRAFPMMMTAAGTVPAARVFVMGAGVAGLQAVATARRLGAVVSATDVRLAAKEQVASLGAKFVMVEDDETKAAETSGGYARDMSDAYKVKQAALIADTISKQDIVITTAQIPGRPAPRLVTRAMIQTMRSGSVIMDMAVESGGNVEGSLAGQVVMQNGVTIVGYKNLPGRVAYDASALYARNVMAVFNHIFNKDSGTVVIDETDAIIGPMRVTNDGQIVKEGI